MNCSHSPIAHEQWLDFLDGKLDPAVSLRVERHCASCSECEQLKSRLISARIKLEASGQDARRRFEVDPGTISRIWDGLRFRIRRAPSEVSESERGIDIEQLRSMLISMCGAGTAEDALKCVAGSRQPGPIATRLGSIIEAICGQKAGRLVEHAAQGVRWERVA